MSGIEGVSVNAGRYEPDDGDPGGLLITNGLLPDSWDVQDWRAFPEPVAAALVVVARRAEIAVASDENRDFNALRSALDALAEAQAGAL